MPKGRDHGSLKRVLMLSTLEGGSAAAINSLLAGTFLTAFTLSLGATAWQVGLFAALAPAMQLGQVFTAYLVERAPSLRRLSISLLVAHRALWAVAGLCALWLPPGINLTVFMALYCTSWLLAAPGVNAWQSLMTEVVPRRLRGRYFGQRWMINTAIAMVALLAAGQIVDTFPGRTGFVILYSLGLLLSVVNWFLLAALPHVPNKSRPPASYWGHLSKPLKDGRFRKVLLWLAGWTFVQLALPPFYTVLMVTKLNLSYALISVLSAVLSISSALSFPIWGRYVDRKGSFALAAPAAAGAALVPTLWLLVGFAGVWFLFPLHVLLGLITAGLQTLTLQLSWQLAPAQERAIYLAVMNGANGLAGFLGPLIAGFLVEAGRFDLLFGGAGVATCLLAVAWRLTFHSRVANPNAPSALTSGPSATGS